MALQAGVITDLDMAPLVTFDLVRDALEKEQLEWSRVPLHLRQRRSVLS